MKHKRKKCIRMRGDTTHGWGSRKKHRGKGHQGGAGNAGTGKRADTKRPTMWKLGLSLGKYGFKGKRSLRIAPVKSINVYDVAKCIDKYVFKQKAEKTANGYKLNLSDIGYDKLLGRGKITIKLEITAKYCSEKAKLIVEEAGGKVNLLNPNNNKE